MMICIAARVPASGARRVSTSGPSLTPRGCGPAVEQAVGLVGVLGEVDVGAVLVDRQRLVGVAAQALDRRRVRRAVSPDLEDVPVVLLEDAGTAVLLPVVPGPVLGLLAGQPRPPRGRPTRTVADGAGDGDELTEVAARAVGRDHGAAAGVDGAGVVDGARDVRHAELGARVDLVVLDQGVAAAAGGEHGHAVVVGRGQALAAVEPGDAGPGDDGVAEALGQGQDAVGVVHERREGHAARPGWRSGPAGAGLGQGRDGTGDGETDAGDAAGEKGTTRGRHVGCSCSGDGYDLPANPCRPTPAGRSRDRSATSK